MDGLHYHVGGGEHGCLYDWQSVGCTIGECAEQARQVYDLGRRRTARLKRDGYLELRPLDGASYVEITKCRNPECWTLDGSLRTD